MANIVDDERIEISSTLIYFPYRHAVVVEQHLLHLNVRRSVNYTHQSFIKEENKQAQDALAKELSQLLLLPIINLYT